MAENKKSFLLYCDLIHTIEELTDEEAGKLFKHVLRYVNDKNPEPPDRITKIAFEPIKQALKRDLLKYEIIREKKRLAGIASAESRKQHQQALTGVESVQQRPTHSTVNDSVSDNVNDSDSVSDNVIKKSKEKRKHFSAPTIEEVQNYFKENGYTKESAIKAWNYYDTGNWKDSKGDQVKNWKQKMQGVWFKDENKDLSKSEVPDWIKKK